MIRGRKQPPKLKRCPSVGFLSEMIDSAKPIKDRSNSSTHATLQMDVDDFPTLERHFGVRCRDPVYAPNDWRCPICGPLKGLECQAEKHEAFYAELEEDPKPFEGHEPLEDARRTLRRGVQPTSREGNAL